MEDEEPMEISGDASAHDLFTDFNSSLRFSPSRQGNLNNSSHVRRSIATSTPSKEFLAANNIRNLSENRDILGSMLNNAGPFISSQSNKNRRRSAPPSRSEVRERNVPFDKKRHKDGSSSPDDKKTHSHNKSFTFTQMGPLPKKETASAKNKIYLMFFLLTVFLIIQFVFISKHPNIGCHLAVKVDHMREHFAQNVFGQHIATELVSVVTQQIKNQMTNSTNNTHTVLSFHGWTGVGKNHITNLMSRLFLPSRVKTYLTPIHFPHESMDSYYELNIPVWVKGNISNCVMNIFVFDELDKASEAVIRGIRQTLLSLAISKEDKKWTLFILLSNSRASDINNFVFAQLEKGRNRDELTHDELMTVLLDDTGKSSWYGQLYKEKLIHTIVPFLPLSKSHIHQCIKRDLMGKGKVPYVELLENVVQELPFYKPFANSELYSTTGCKRVSDKVDLHIHGDSG